MSRHRHDIENEYPSARRLVVTGRVQGVGFRPFVYRIAHAHALKGWVRNSAGQVLIHIEGSERDIERFERVLVAAAPPLARPRIETSQGVRVQAITEFRILDSEDSNQPAVHLPPDLFCCDACVASTPSRSPARIADRSFCLSATAMSLAAAKGLWRNPLPDFAKAASWR
jgi:hydrogenase maturation protein HypF